MEKRSQNFNVALFSDTIDHRNLNLGTLVVFDVGFLKMYVLITFHEGQRSPGATVSAKMGFLPKTALFQPLW